MEIDSRELASAQRAIRKALRDAGMAARDIASSILNEPWLSLVGDRLTVSHAPVRKGGDIEWVHRPDFYLSLNSLGIRLTRGEHQVSQGMRYNRSFSVGDLIVEIDGSIHNKNVKGTVQRNVDYGRAGISYVVVNTEDAKMCREKWTDDLYNAIHDHMGVVPK